MSAVSKRNSWIFGFWEEFWLTAGFGCSSGCGGLFAAVMFSAGLAGFFFIIILIAPLCLSTCSR